MLNIILLSFSALLIIPSIIGLFISMTTRGIQGITVGVWSVVRIVTAVGKYLIIPLASFILLAPDSWRTILPNSSTTLGVVILIVASLVLLMEMFKGLGSALAISFWAALCLIIVGAFQLDRYLPKDLSFSSVQTQLASLGQRAPARSIPAPQHAAPQRHSKQDGLEFSDFSTSQPVSARAPLTAPQFSFPDFGISSVEGAVQDALTPAMGIFGLGHDQSISSLPKEIYFSPKTPKRQYYGLSSNSDSSDLDLGALDPTGGFLSKLLDR